MGVKMTEATPMRAAIYTRISEDPKGLQNGVSRQQEDCEALAASRGWKVVACYSDNDISALKGKFRPGYAELMAAAERGEFDHLP
ncbi:recombinase family protein [Rhodococcus sp. HNM0563]|uniref:recombinase family protein n=1 Tax=Rhodococcus sp. HNM0563 TaxID=2716339 RepID=UPI00198124BB|nr:recombinase family protein [Rhodococcus sp. HNM0563]